MERHAPPALPGWISALLPPGVRRYSVSLAGLSLHVMEVGEGTPVWLQHGNPTWGFLWRQVMMQPDCAGLRLIAPDLPGLGLSSRVPPGWHTLENHAETLGALMDAVAPGPLIFCGQDWGGPIGLLAMAQRAERLAGLVVLNTTVGPPREGFKSKAFHRLARSGLTGPLLFRGLNFPQGLLHLAQGDPGSIRGEVSRAYRWPLRGIASRSAPLALARMVPDRMTHPSVAPLTRCRAFVEGYKGPAAIVWGERDPILGRLLRRTRRALPHAAVTATDAGHFLQEEVPGEIAAALRGVAEAAAP